ncbi:hypothetical protein F5B21DRAFT_520701 [Xylaria acuta]|nr:hypothetical protein F5B21DRAFT_520701 [Xylaria acuta]
MTEILSQQTFSNKLVAKLTSNSEPYYGAMIRNLPPARPSTIHRVSSRPTLGVLDALPAELLLMILDLLDFQSLSRISRVSLHGKAVVEGLPAYRDMMTHAPKVLNALRRKRALRYHPASLLRQALRSSKCVCCSEFGAFLFLPTCERVCFGCLNQNRAFRMTTLASAGKFFGLTESQLNRIPIIHSTPTRPYELQRLVSAEQVKQLVIEVHWTVENIANLMQKLQAGKITSGESRLLGHFHETAYSEPAGRHFWRWPEKPIFEGNELNGMASIRFPYVTEAGADYGRACRGCRVTYHHYQDGLLPAKVLSELVSPGILRTYHPYRAITARLRSTDEFREHIKHCYGVTWLL